MPPRDHIRSVFGAIDIVAVLITRKLIANAATAVDRIVAQAAAHNIDARAAVEMIVAFIAGDGVVPTLTVDLVLTGVAREIVHTLVGPVDRIVALFAVDAFAKAAACIEIVVPSTAPDPVGTESGVDPVVAIAAEDVVGTAQAVDGVVPAAAVDPVAEVSGVEEVDICVGPFVGAEDLSCGRPRRKDDRRCPCPRGSSRSQRRRKDDRCHTPSTTSSPPLPYAVSLPASPNR